MDDSCAVCAEVLEWVAYGECGHKDVCSTCVARLRFICGDRRCCICKTESSVVFVTKALGDYTNAISNFSVFLREAREGRVGKYWYHEDTQAFFDDSDHYKMIKAMCKLSCSVCDKMEGQTEDGTRRKQKFRNIEQLKGHLFHKHRLIMCSLCLEGRKVFVCEQRLYTRAQLSQHIKAGNSEVDGSESERGGFMGHPICEFCKTPFYGDNELYTHMSTEHYTCHICQRKHPGQFEYYKNYNDLEVHFRRDHFLCEDEACLSKKFIVFQFEAELKKHSASEHGGRMSRSQRSAALQIPISFRYRRSNEQENHRGRGRMFQRDTSDSELSMPIQVTLQTANSDGRFHATAPSGSSVVTDHEDIGDIESLIPPLESLATADAQPTSRYLQAVSQSARNSTLEESLFPPLSVASGVGQQDSHPLPKNTMASRLRHQSKKKVNASSSAVAWPAASRTSAPPAITSNKWPAIGTASGSASSSSQSKQATELVQPTVNPRAWPVIHTATGSASGFSQSKQPTENGVVLSSYSSSSQARPSSIYDLPFAGSSSSLRNGRNTGRISHSTSTPNLSQGESFDSSNSDFPPVSAAHTSKQTVSDQAVLKVQDVQSANKSLVEKIRAALGFDEEKYTTFKMISNEFRQGLMDVETYLAYVEQFSLSHLVLELTRLLPDALKQKELIDTYNANMKYRAPTENGYSGRALENGNSSTKGKGKALASGNRSSKNDLADSFINTVKDLQYNYKSSEEGVEALSKVGYRVTKGKSEVVVANAQAELNGSGESTKLKSQNDSSATGAAARSSGDGSGKVKRKKTSKFHRIRLGDGSAEALLEFKGTEMDSDSDPNQKAASDDQDTTEGLPRRGVWQSGGGRRLLAVTSRGPKI